MNVLITSASRKMSLVHAFQDALRKTGGGKVIAVDVSPLAPALYGADDHYLVPRSDDPGFVASLVELCRSQHVGVLVPTRDEELPLFAEHCEAFGEVGTRVMVASSETVAICQDKLRFAEFCRENGFVTPRVYGPEELRGELPLPVFVKPRRGKGGRHTAVVRCRSELEALLPQAGELVVQECVSAPEFTIDLFADFEGNVISAVPRERVFVFGGESFVTRTCDDPQLVGTSAELSRALGLVGHNTIQCFAREDGPLFIEVNPRYGGAAHLGFAAGAPTPEWAVRLLRGERLGPRLGEYVKDLTMLRYTEDLFLRPGQLTERRWR